MIGTMLLAQVAATADNSVDFGATILATAALGTAAFGIVEALKGTPLGEAGFASIKKLLGPLMLTLRTAYGQDYEALLLGQYRGDSAELARTLRQGVRVGLTTEHTQKVAEFLGTVDGDSLEAAVRMAESGGDLPAELRNVIGRFELAADARIDAGLAKARSVYANTLRVTASILALGIAGVVGMALGRFWQGMLVGLCAVPLAPVAKDLVAALQAATTALKGKA
jgi:hypothetical protein